MNCNYNEKSGLTYNFTMDAKIYRMNCYWQIIAYICGGGGGGGVVLNNIASVFIEYIAVK